MNNPKFRSKILSSAKYVCNIIGIKYDTSDKMKNMKKKVIHTHTHIYIN